ncbi:hypothetical protein IRJ41_006978 [Triplophysa rosa]|uniref:Uncharacterized protein n=1 Tax=Triplophysa rosa TaxID=992332 RepID=A0A9W7WQK4_TRIRA|nr:hypothetical protein IRJ41_006978 [Triplophysa rosa]
MAYWEGNGYTQFKFPILNLTANTAIMAVDSDDVKYTLDCPNININRKLLCSYPSLDPLPEQGLPDSWIAVAVIAGIVLLFVFVALLIHKLVRKKTALTVFFRILPVEGRRLVRQDLLIMVFLAVALLLCCFVLTCGFPDDLKCLGKQKNEISSHQIHYQVTPDIKDQIQHCEAQWLVKEKVVALYDGNIRFKFPVVNATANTAIMEVNSDVKYTLDCPSINVHRRLSCSCKIFGLIDSTVYSSGLDLNNTIKDSTTKPKVLIIQKSTLWLLV